MQNYSEAVVLIKRLPMSDAEAKLEDRMSTVLSKLIVISKPHMINYMAKCSKTGTCHRGKQIHIHECCLLIKSQSMKLTWGRRFVTPQI